VIERVASPAAGNRLLASLSNRDCLAIEARCTRIELKFGQVLAEPDARIRHIYFPIDSFISLVARADAESTLEVGLIGSEGMLGATVALGIGLARLHATVQGDGEALRMSALQTRRELAARPAFRAAVLRYCYVLLRQVSQMAACTHYHPVQARLARWLLMTHDRARGSSLHLTQEFLGQMLGVRRVGVTQAASALKADRLIGYHRGEIAILDRRGLEAASCVCYAADRLLVQHTLG
jgi:CRP-like cAMP-binding protein